MLSVALSSVSISSEAQVPVHMMCMDSFAAVGIPGTQQQQRAVITEREKQLPQRAGLKQDHTAVLPPFTCRKKKPLHYQLDRCSPVRPQTSLAGQGSLLWSTTTSSLYVVLRLS